jgi:hypothetical protein
MIGTTIVFATMRVPIFEATEYRASNGRESHDKNQMLRTLCKVNRYSVTTNIVAATVLNITGWAVRPGETQLNETFHSSLEDISGARLPSSQVLHPATCDFCLGRTLRVLHGWTG